MIEQKGVLKESPVTATSYHEMSSAQHINYRKSGLLMAGILVVFYIVLFMRGKHQPYIVAIATAIAMLAWFETWPIRKTIDLFIGIGNYMNRLTNPLVFGLIYAIAVIPVSIVLKLIRKDVLLLQYDLRVTSYWKERSAGKTWIGSFRKQF